jgi:starch synthase
VAVEAMLAGKPVVAARTGGLNDVVAHGETGLLVAPGDTPAFARALLDILNDPVHARRLGEAGRQRAQARFGVERMARDFATLYARLAGPDLDTVRPAVPPSAAPDESTPDLERAA